VIKSTKAKRVCHVTGMLKGRFWQENLKGTYHFEDIGVDGRIILKQIL